MMRSSLSFLAAALYGLAAASPAAHNGPYGYHPLPIGTAPSGGVSSSVISSGTGHGPYPTPSASSVIPKPSSTGHGPYHSQPSGTGVIPPPHGTGSTSQIIYSSSSKPSGTGVIPHSSGTGAHSSQSSSAPAGTGHSGTGSGPEVTPKPSKPPKTITHTGDVTTTTTITHVYTSTIVKTITHFVPQSTPVATQDSSTFYSSYLSISYSTTTVTLTTTTYEVICPRTTPSDAKPTSAHGHYQVPGQSSNHEAASVTDVPVPSTHAIPTYLPHTSYAPPVGNCPPAQVIYSTIVIEVTTTKTVEAPYTHNVPEATHKPSIPGDNHGKPSHQPPYPVPHGSSKPIHHPSGTGAGTGSHPRPTGSGHAYAY